ncbi:MAG TPA: POTRA domain-containing protein [Polyangiaceae bacterium]|nr:POTRA domain-containing protein [Polyangiaceae bacterium]
MRILDTHTLKAGEIGDKIATAASTKFLFLLEGVAYDYSIYDESTLQRDMARVERFYRSRGFFDAHARVARVLQVGPKHVRVEIGVDEGPPTINRNTTFFGIDALPGHVADAVRRVARDAMPHGRRFDEDAFENSEAAVKKALTDRSYAFAVVDAQAEVDIGANVADYGFKVAPGPSAVFGPISFAGLDSEGSGLRKAHIGEDQLRRTIAIRPGAPYSTAEIDAATQALLELGVFSAVQIVPSLPDPPPADHAVPLTVKLEPVRMRQITLGGGVELDEIKTDLHLVAAWEDRNFLGGLRDFRVSFKPGVVLYPIRVDNWSGAIHPLPEAWLTVQLRQPGVLESRTTGFIRPQLNVFPMLVEVNPPADAPVVGYREVKIPLGFERTFTKKLLVSIGYTSQVEDPFAYIGGLEPGLKTIWLSYPELVTSLDFRDDVVRPHSGIYLGSTLQTAGGIFGGSATDVRIQPEIRSYVPIARGLTLATRASVGFLWASSYGQNWNAELESSATTTSSAITAPTAANLAQRATLERDIEIVYFRGFFSGGPATNRGFPLLAVAPHGVVPFLNPGTASQQVMSSCTPTSQRLQDSAAAAESCFLPVGGFTLWELQNEVRADIAGPLSGTVFCDLGDVSPNQNDIRLSHLHLSCGVGAAYDTPVGPIRADLGYRVQPLQVLGFANEYAAWKADPVNGLPPRLFTLPIALAIGIGQAF